MQNKEVIKITLFGKLTISYHGESIELSHAIGKQLITLFEMLAYYQSHALSKETIMDTLWIDNDNPNNVLKYSVFRLRNYLKKIPFLAELNLITTGKNGYLLNPEYTYEIDTVCFDNASHQLKASGFNEETMPYALALLDVYEGDIYLGEQNNWSIQASSYYRSIYQEYVRKVCAFYQHNDEHEALLPIAFKASKLCPEYEDVHYYYLRSMISLGEFDKALSYYNTITKMLVNEYEIAISERMRKLYYTIMLNNEKLVTINDLQEQLFYAQPLDHAFYCEYDVFEYLYHAALRRTQRMKMKYYIVLFNLHACLDHEELKVMNKLKRTIGNTLRSVDVYTRVNKFQYCALISCEDESSAHLAAQRVMSQFTKRVNTKTAKVAYNILDIKEKK